MLLAHQTTCNTTQHTSPTDCATIIALGYWTELLCPSLPRRRSYGFVTQWFLSHIRGAGMHDEPLRMYAWEASCALTHSLEDLTKKQGHSLLQPLYCYCLLFVSFSPPINKELHLSKTSSTWSFEQEVMLILDRSSNMNLWSRGRY